MKEEVSLYPNEYVSKVVDEFGDTREVSVTVEESALHFSIDFYALGRFDDNRWLSGSMVDGRAFVDWLIEKFYGESYLKEIK